MREGFEVAWILKVCGTMHCQGWTILTRRQNVTADCLNFAKLHFAIPDRGCVTLAKFYSRLHLELNSRFFLRASRGGFPSRSRLDSDHCCFSPSPLHPPDHKSTSYYPYLVIFISRRLCPCSWRISPVHTSWNRKIKPQYMLTMICLIPYHGVHFADYLSNLPITWMSHWDPIWITRSWPEGTCSSSEMCIKGELFPPSQAPLYLQQLCLLSFAFSHPHLQVCPVILATPTINQTGLISKSSLFFPL